MVDPVNLNVLGLDYPFFAIVFCGVVALFTLVLARAEIALQRKRRTIVTRGSALLESHRIEGRLEWVVVRGRDALEQAGREQMRRPPQGQRQDGKREGEHEHVFLRLRDHDAIGVGLVILDGGRPRRISSDRGGTNTFGTIACPYNSNGIFDVIYDF